MIKCSKMINDFKNNHNFDEILQQESALEKFWESIENFSEVYNKEGKG